MDGRELKKRPCRVCQRWFRPDPRTRRQQKTCGQPECRAAWQGKRQKAWRDRNRDYDAHRRLIRELDRVGRQDPADPIEMGPPPEIAGQVPWRLVQTVMGAEKAVVTWFLLRLLDRRMQTVMRLWIGLPPGYPARLLPAPRQTEMEVAGGQPDDPR